MVYTISRMPRPRAPGARTRRATSQKIVDRIHAAVLEHRLPPGAKLGEGSLGELFGVSRTIVRQALFRLAEDKLVTLLPARGAFVSRPSVREARELFEARRVIELELIERFTRALAPEGLAQMREHLARERAAIAAGDAALRNRLLGEFHVLIAEHVGNGVLRELLSELVSRSSLVTLLYQSAREASCSADEHEALLDAVARRDVAAARRLMQEHLGHVESGLALPDEAPAEVDLRAVLALERS